MTTDEGRAGRSRRGDYATSEAGARDIGRRAPNQRLRLLAQYPGAGRTGLTDEEACKAAELSLRSNYWKRCGELRQDRCIEQQVVEGREVTRKGDAGVDAMVCTITPVGYAVLRAHDLVPEETTS